MTQIAIVANGIIEDYSFIRSLIQAYDFIIAADGGAVHCNKMHITPDLIIGDLDSIPKIERELYSGVLTQSFDQDKDKTDLQLAVEHALRTKAEKVTLFGAGGGRLDHTLSNLFLLCLKPMKIFIETEKELIFALGEGTSFVDAFPGQIVSLFPLGEKTEGVTTDGLKWELQDATLNNTFISISNEALGKKVKVSIKKGLLIYFTNKRRNHV